MVIKAFGFVNFNHRFLHTLHLTRLFFWETRVSTASSENHYTQGGQEKVHLTLDYYQIKIWGKVTMAYWNKIKGRRQGLWQIAMYSSNICQWFSFSIQIILHIAVASAPLKDRKTQCINFSENYWEKARKMAFILEVDTENRLTSLQKYTGL